MISDVLPGNPYEGDQYCWESFNPYSDSVLDYLIFLDSRGFGLENPGYREKSWAARLASEFKSQGKTFHLVARPKELTIFFTLINFLKASPKSYKNLITNMGFVDFTPKKDVFLKDIESQRPYNFSDVTLQMQTFETYLFNDGTVSELHSFEYKNLSNKLAEFLIPRFHSICLLGTTECTSELKLPRYRPESFYQQLKRTNEFLHELAGHSNIIDLLFPLITAKEKDTLMTYDAVHFTPAGHEYFWKNLQARFMPSSSSLRSN